MQFFNMLRQIIMRKFSIANALLLSLVTTPAFADGFKPANTVMQKIATGLHGLAAITITVAVVWVGYKTLWKGESLSQCAYIIIGGILIGGGSEFAALVVA